MKKPAFKINPRSRTVVDVQFKLKAGEEQWFLLSSDRHWDNPKSNLAMQKKHLDEAKEKGAGIIDIGDMFCAMQGRYDPRGSKQDIRKEHMRGDYLDALVETSADFFRPYAENFVLIGQGNHESSILKRLETDLTTRLVERINTLEKTKVHRGGFSGWVVFRVATHGNCYEAKRLFFHHGYGGDAPVTKGVIQTSRMAVYLPDADFVATGHTHNEWQFPISRTRISSQGRTFFDEQVHIKIPSYKQDYGDGFAGWDIERGAPPKPNGAIWLRIWNHKDGSGDRLRSELTRAK